MCGVGCGEGRAEPVSDYAALVERVARTICAAHHGKNCRDWRDEEPEWRETYRDFARAAITEVRAHDGTQDRPDQGHRAGRPTTRRQPVCHVRRPRRRPPTDHAPPNQPWHGWIEAV